MFEKNILLSFMAFWSLLALFFIGTDICSNYHWFSKIDWFILINRKYNCELAYGLIVPCILFSIIGSLLSIDLKK